MHLLVVAVNSKLKTVDRKLPNKANDLVNKFSYNIESYPKYYMNEDNFEEDVESNAVTDESDSSNSGNNFIN